MRRALSPHGPPTRYTVSLAPPTHSRTANGILFPTVCIPPTLKALVPLMSALHSRPPISPPLLPPTVTNHAQPLLSADQSSVLPSIRIPRSLQSIHTHTQTHTSTFTNDHNTLTSYTLHTFHSDAALISGRLLRYFRTSSSLNLRSDSRTPSEFPLQSRDRACDSAAFGHGRMPISNKI